MREKWDHRDDCYNEEEDYSVGAATGDASFIIWFVVLISLFVGGGPILWEFGKLFAILYIPLLIIAILAAFGGSSSSYNDDEDEYEEEYEDEYDDDYDYDEYEEEDYDDY